MRRPQGALLPPVSAARVRRGDVYRVLRAAVLDGTLRSGERLPSTRQAAADYRVSRGMVEEVFAQLTEEGFLERAVGRGTYVSPTVSRLSTPAKAKSGQQRSPSRRGQRVAANAACRSAASAIEHPLYNCFTRNAGENQISLAQLYKELGCKIQ